MITRADDDWGHTFFYRQFLSLRVWGQSLIPSTRFFLRYTQSIFSVSVPFCRKALTKLSFCTVQPFSYLISSLFYQIPLPRRCAAPPPAWDLASPGEGGNALDVWDLNGIPPVLTVKIVFRTPPEELDIKLMWVFIPAFREPV